MSKQDDVVLVPLVVQGLIETACFDSVPEFIQALTKYLAVQIPTTITNVIVSNTQPLSSERTSIWVRLNNAGSFIGFYVYSGGTWQAVFPPPNGIIPMYGDSRDVPKGFTLADEDNAKVGTYLGTLLKARWIRDQTNTYWVYFETTFDGL